MIYIGRFYLNYVKLKFSFTIIYTFMQKKNMFYPFFQKYQHNNLYQISIEYLHLPKSVTRERQIKNNKIIIFPRIILLSLCPYTYSPFLALILNFSFSILIIYYVVIIKFYQLELFSEIAYFPLSLFCINPVQSLGTARGYCANRPVNLRSDVNKFGHSVLVL